MTFTLGIEYHLSVVMVGAMIRVELFAGALTIQHWLMPSLRSLHRPTDVSAIGTKRTYRVALHMSAIGVKQTSLSALQMSAYDPKQTLSIQRSACRCLRYALSEKPQIASRPATTRPTHETVMDMEWGPICTVHPLKILKPCKIATNAKMSAVINA